MMKTIVWKEIREHARWVPLGVIAIAIVLILQWRASFLIFDGTKMLQSLVGLVASGIAICLGALQSWPDHRPAARALLLHRGITANTVFWGKLLSGFLLYAVAVFVPLLAMAAFIVAVGIDHKPATPAALLPSALISVASFSCWLASMLAVQRDAWILGSRLFPGVIAAMAILLCSILINAMLWLAIAIALVTLIVLVAIAQSVFVNSSHVATGGGRAGLTVVVTTVLMTVTVCTGSSRRRAPRRYRQCKRP